MTRQSTCEYHREIEPCLNCDDCADEFYNCKECGEISHYSALIPHPDKPGEYSFGCGKCGHANHSDLTVGFREYVNPRGCEFRLNEETGEYEVVKGEG